MPVVRPPGPSPSASGSSSSSSSSSVSRWKLASLLAVSGGALTLGVVHAEPPFEARQPPYLHPPTVDTTHKDRTTGLEFNKKITVETEGKLTNIHVLVGTGCKYRFGMMKQYAVGLYLPPNYAKAAGSDDLVLAPVVNGDVSASWIIRINNDVDVKTFLGHLEDALRFSISNNGKMVDKEKANSAVNLFRDMIVGGSDTATLPRGSSLMVAREGDKIWLHAQGKKLGSIQNADLARALFDIFLGPRPLSQEAKEAFGRGIRGDMYNL